MADEERDHEVERTEEGLRVCWCKSLPRRVWLNTRPGEVWLLPDPEAAMARVAAGNDETGDPARWTRAQARRFVGDRVTPLPMPEDPAGFFSVAAYNRWLNCGWVH